MKNLTQILLSAAVLTSLTLGSCGGSNSEEEKYPLRGYWKDVDGQYQLSITNECLVFTNSPDMDSDGMLLLAAITDESPSKIQFHNDDYQGTVEYKSSDKSVTITIKGAGEDGSDYSLTMPACDRYDMVTPYYSVERIFLKDRETKEVIDTLFPGETVRWICDTINGTRVLLDDGRLAYADQDYFDKTRGQVTERAFERDYVNRRHNVGSESISLERDGNQVVVISNFMPADNPRAIESYYLGELKGNVINVTKSLSDYSDKGSATPLDTPFTIAIIDNDKPRLVKDGKNYFETNF